MKKRIAAWRLQHTGRHRIEVGEAMVHAGLRLSFTGSNRSAAALREAAKRGAKVTCEMGGRTVIVMPDADLDKAARPFGGAFGSTGQRYAASRA